MRVADHCKVQIKATKSESPVDRFDRTLRGERRSRNFTMTSVSDIYDTVHAQDHVHVAKCWSGDISIWKAQA